MQKQIGAGRNLNYLASQQKESDNGNDWREKLFLNYHFIDRVYWRRGGGGGGGGWP